MANKSQITSRYAITPMVVDQYVRKGKVRFDMWVKPQLTARPEIPLDDQNVSIYTVKRQDLGRLDLLAYSYYGNVSLWWIIAAYNGIVNPLIDMTVGQSLRIPNKTLVEQIIQKTFA